MREMAINRFESIMQVLKAMPRPMLLVFRNINTVRSINITLGAPVDRYFVMAKRFVWLMSATMIVMGLACLCMITTINFKRLYKPLTPRALW